MKLLRDEDFRIFHSMSPCPMESNITQSAPEEINILLLGETGVGKTTYVNSLVNNLRHKTLESIMKDKLRILVDIAFTISDEVGNHKFSGIF